jgi:hypothetical protein
MRARQRRIEEQKMRNSEEMEKGIVEQPFGVDPAGACDQLFRC